MNYIYYKFAVREFSPKSIDFANLLALLPPAVNYLLYSK